MGDFFSRQECLFFQGKVSNHLALPLRIQTLVPQGTMRDAFQTCWPQGRFHLTVGHPRKLSLYPQSFSTYLACQRLPCMENQWANVSTWHHQKKLWFLRVFNILKKIPGQQLCIINLLIVFGKWCSRHWLAWPVITRCLKMSSDVTPLSLVKLDVWRVAIHVNCCDFYLLCANSLFCDRGRDHSTAQKISSRSPKNYFHFYLQFKYVYVTYCIICICAIKPAIYFL